jgi:predicted transcriptional regulator
MMINRTIFYIDEILIRRPAIKTDAALARELGITKQAIGIYRQGGAMNVYVAVRIARMLDLNPMETISATMHQQAKTEAERQFWRDEYLAVAAAWTPRSQPPTPPPQPTPQPHPRRRGRFR